MTMAVKTIDEKSHNYKKKQIIIRCIFIKIMSLRHDYYYIKKLIIKTHNKVIIMTKKSDGLVSKCLCFIS